jgi:hypothetical protein
MDFYKTSNEKIDLSAYGSAQTIVGAQGGALT